MTKKKVTSKERGKIALLSILAIISSFSTVISLIAFLGDDYNLTALIVLVLSLSALIWAISNANKLQKVIDDRSVDAPYKTNTNLQTGHYCEHCGAEISAGAKFCNACGQKISGPSVPVSEISHHADGLKCPNCGSHSIQYQTVAESRKAGCGTVFIYVILALTIFGLFIVIPLMLRKKTETVTYAVCQNCGNRWRIK